MLSRYFCINFDLLPRVAAALLTGALTAGCVGVSEASNAPDSSRQEAGSKAAPSAATPKIKTSKHESSSSNAPLSLVQTAQDKPILETAGAIEVRGTALAARQSYLSAPVPGIIDTILVRRGDVVTKNQPLVLLDKRGFQLGVQQAKAALDATVAQEEQLVTEITRMRKLLASDAAPAASLEQLQAKQKGADASVRMARAALGQARKAASDAVVRAPYGGVITDILKEKGENAPAMPPTMLVKIVDTSSLEIQAFLPENRAQDVKVGDTARVRIDSANVDKTGKVIFVSNAIAPGTRTFEVRAQLDNPDGAVKAGSFARVTFK